MPKISTHFSTVLTTANIYIAQKLIFFIICYKREKLDLDFGHFSFGYVFPNSMSVQSFIMIKWQEKKLSMIKIEGAYLLSQLLLATGLIYI